MTEKEKMQHPPIEKEQNNKAPAETISEQFRLNYTRLLWLLVSGALLFVVSYLVIYTKTQAWQLLAAAGLTVAAVICAAIGYYILNQREKKNAAGYWGLAGLIIGYGGAEMLFSGMTLYLTIGGTLLILLASNLLLPRKWWSWGIALAIFETYIWAINFFTPLSRYNIAQNSFLLYTIPGLTGILILLSLWQVIQSFRFGTIRTRLLIAFTSLAVLLTIIISTTWIIMSYNNAQGQITNQLESIATLKEAEIQTWAKNLKVNLNIAINDEKGLPNLKILLSPQTADTEEVDNSYKEVQQRLRWAIEQMTLFEEMFILDLQGQAVVYTNPAQEGKVYANETFFQEGLQGAAYIRPPVYDLMAKTTTVLVSQPIRDEEGKIIALIVGHANLDTLNSIMSERSGLGETGETYLVDNGYGMLTEPRFGEKEGYLSTQGTKTTIHKHTNGSGIYKSYHNKDVVGVYHWLPEFQIALLAEQQQNEAFSSIYQVGMINVGVALAAVLGSMGLSLLITRSIANPLARLAETASQIASGDIERTAEVNREDEIGTLAQAFNQMTSQLRDLIGNLEKRVLERTQKLEQRSTYLEASATVSRAAASILDIEQLIQTVVELIYERFDLYYVGLFVIDENSEWAILNAGTGEAGRQMLQQEHKLKVGGASMIGQCVAQSEAQIALDVGEEAVRFDNPLLPETRSEGALPLRSRGNVLGAFTIQSKEAAAFDEKTITVLQTMADQVAVALDNAQLFTEANTALEAERRAYGELSRQAWRNLLQSQSQGYDLENRSLTPAQGNWSHEMKQAQETGKSVLVGTNLAVPIKIRGQALGVLSFEKDNPGESWEPEEQALLENLTEELARTLESARLYQDTQRRATQERLTSEITAHMRETLNIETVLKTAVNEISEAMNLAALDVQFGLSPNTSEENTSE